MKGIIIYTIAISFSFFSLVPMAHGYDEKEIRRAIASNTPITEILKAASRARLNAGMVTKTLIRGGVPPGMAVYMAIVEGYPVDKVVQSAIEEKGLPDIVFTSAINAGADAVKVAQAVVDMGANKEDTADILSRIMVAKTSLPGN